LPYDIVALSPFAIYSRTGLVFAPTQHVTSQYTDVRMSLQASPQPSVASFLVRAARRWPALPALASGAAAICDYAELASRAARLAGAFGALGLQQGERVLIVSRNVPSYIEALFGCWWAGLVAVPVNAKLHPKELAFVVDNCRPRVALVDAAWQSAIGELRPQRPALVVAELGGAEYARLLTGPPRECAPVPADAPAWLFYTSGTTGRPKGVVISHGNLSAMSDAFLACVEEVRPGDALFHPAPLSHGSGLYVLPHVLAGAVQVVPESGAFDADEILSLLSAWRRASFFAPPTIVKRLAAAPSLSNARVDHLKSIIYGGGPMYVADAKAAYAALGPRLAQIYGQGESPMTITAMDRATIAAAIASGDDARLGSVGAAQTGIELRIADANDDELPRGEAGEVLVRGATVMNGYWENPEATCAALANRWLHTGDIGSLDRDGYLTLKDRSKDLIVSGGSNIYPREVEEVLLRHPDVAEAAVIGRVHPEWGEEVVACIVTRGASTPDGESRRRCEQALDKLCLAHIARFKRPRGYVFVDELPKNNTGKVLKNELRRRFADDSKRDS
jgi:long-chain acyl-CoA synthetase